MRLDLRHEYIDLDQPLAGRERVPVGALVAAGLPPVVANATSAVAVTPANLASAWAYRREVSRHPRWTLLLVLVSLAHQSVRSHRFHARTARAAHGQRQLILRAKDGAQHGARARR